MGFKLSGVLARWFFVNRPTTHRLGLLTTADVCFWKIFQLYFVVGFRFSPEVLVLCGINVLASKYEVLRVSGLGLDMRGFGLGLDTAGLVNITGRGPLIVGLCNLQYTKSSEYCLSIMLCAGSQNKRTGS